jgi:NAD(P)-dependent dehydrogenase (short-subunit alcohol dehydrogenase family)
MSELAGKSILVTGANRGLGRALVAEALKRGAGRVYAGTRQRIDLPDERVIPVSLDVTDPARIRAAAELVEGLDVLVNNAGLALPVDDLSDRAALEQLLAVNLFGTFEVTQAFLPALTASRGAVVNILSTSVWANMPLMPAYSVSKAAAFSLTQSMRAFLAGRGVRVHAAIVGVVDTDMTKAFDVPKASPESVANGILEGVENGEEEIFPDPMSEPMAEIWRGSAFKALEREYAALVAGEEQ